MPNGGIILDKAGNVYGTTVSGGLYQGGTVFRVSPTGQEEVLYSFAGGSDGDSPGYGLAADSAGNLYGVAKDGLNGGGVVYKISP